MTAIFKGVKENHKKYKEVEFNLQGYLLSIQNLIQLKSDTVLLPSKDVCQMP